MSMKRRDFFKLTALASTSLVAGAVRAESETEPIDCDKVFAVLVDTVICIGCRKCEWACNNANSLATEDLKAFEDKSVFAKRRRPTDKVLTVVNAFADRADPEKKYTVKIQCMHCNDPACASACLVGAMKKNSRGPVAYDAWKCIGCRYCMIACPFQVPAYEYQNAVDPQVRKCTFCATRVLEQSGRPACVEICPCEALVFGSRADLIDLAQSRIKAHNGRYVDHIYGEKEVGGTSWMYLAGVDFAATGLPKLSEEPPSHQTEPIQHGIFKSFVPPLALYGLLGLVMSSLRQRNDREAKDE
jgi:Fe-S-cluster-containing dehydrogenase component